MSLRSNQLKSVFVQNINKPGRYFDGNGLYLQVTPKGSKSWIFRFAKDGKEHRMGLGPLSLISLAEARMKALEAKRSLFDGKHPLQEKKTREIQVKLKRKNINTFDQCKELYLAQHKPAWDPVTYRQWNNSLKYYVTPTIGNLPVSEIDTELVLRVIQPIWHDKTETASRVRNRIELILDYAKVLGFRTGENPARWRGHLDNLLPNRTKLKPIKHFKALPYKELPSFVQKLRARNCTTSLALEFLILTATRTNEVLEARREEFDMSDNLWIIPANRMKAKKEHRIPLCPRAKQIIEKLSVQSDFSAKDLIFPGANANKPLSSNALLNLLERMGVDVTVHGFRSTFRDWAGETTSHPREVIEAALAHSLQDKAEAAYARGDLLKKRKALMDDWSNYAGMT